MTLREHLEAIRDGMAAVPREATYRANREARAHAIAALEELENGREAMVNGDMYRLVPDPGSSA